MNVWALIILGFLALCTGLDILAGFLSLSRARKGPGPELDGLYPEGSYPKVLSYLSSRTRFSAAEEGFSLLLLVIFWFAGGFEAWDRLVRGFGGGMISGLLFLGGLAFFSSVLSLPFDLYGTFVLEERFGFNRTSLKTFIADRAKGAAIALALGAPLACGVMWFFTRLPEFAWLYAWALCAAVAVALQVLAPSLILPWFFRLSPLPPGSLREAVEKLSRDTGFPIKDVFLVDGSRRSAKANAFFLGMGNNRRVALFDTLVEKHGEDEIAAVLAHELGHAKGRHSLQGLIVSLLSLGLMLFLLSLFVRRPELFSAFFMTQPSVYAGLALFSLVAAPLYMVLGVLGNSLSRRNERAADRFAAQNIEDPESLVTALRRLFTDNYANPNPHPLAVALHYSHPPLSARIKNIRVARSEG